MRTIMYHYVHMSSGMEYKCFIPKQVQVKLTVHALKAYDVC